MSIVVPVFNGEVYLRGALESALAQTFPAHEVLVFDNASTDSSVAVATDILGANSVYTSDRNRGAVHNFNGAARAATGDLILWLGADDLLEPHHLEHCVAALRANPTSVACLPGIQFIDQDGRKLRKTSDVPLSRPQLDVRLRSFLRRPRWTEFYCLYRREALFSGNEISNEWGSDVLFTWWFLLRGPLAVISEPLLNYRELPSKPPEVTEKAIDPAAHAQHWRHLRMWGRLWSMTKDPELPGNSGRIGRRELLLCWVHGSWLRHLARDIGFRWPVIGGPMKRFDRRIRRILRPDEEFA